jgi:hypothetical protein
MPSALLVRVLGAVVLPIAVAAQHPLPSKFAPRPTTGAITPTDLMTRVYAFADDSMMGRHSGTVHHDKATDYIARELTRFGLQPGGDNGTFFQQLPVATRALAQGSKITVDGRDFLPGRDFVPRDPRDLPTGPGPKAIQNAVAVYGGTFGDTSSMIKPADAVGKVVVLTVQRGWQANRMLLTAQHYVAATAVVLASLDSMPDEVRKALSGPTMAPSRPPQREIPIFLYATRAMAEAMLGMPLSSARTGAAGRVVTASLNYSEAQAPGMRNVVAILPGSDPALKNQYVAIGAHSDHEGVGEAVDHDSLYAFYHVVRPGGADDDGKAATAEDWPKVRKMLDSLRRTRPARVDSIFNGADDDASGSMGMLEVAEAFATAREKPKRSILFVWHVAEEQGLVGARYYTDNPTVPRDSIVGQINIDMIGRGGAADTPGGGPGYVQLIGSRRLSTELGDLVEAEGKKFSPQFRFDYTYDANGHPGQFYCRSDHYMYARYGIPVVFLSTGGHPEYHQVTDEPQYIDYAQLARVSQLVYNMAARVANLDHRLVVDKPKPDPNGPCRQ